MKVEYINPFIEAVHETFTSMLDSSVDRGEIGVSTGASHPRDITAFIGLSGPARGAVTLSFPTPTALSVVGRLLGQELHIVDDGITDGISEMVNIVAGGAKSKLSRVDGPPIELGLPNVVRGNGYEMRYSGGVQWLEVPFTSDLGPFTMRVVFDFN